MKIKLLALVLMLGLIGSVQATELKDSLFSDFSRVQDYCNSSLDYDLNNSFEDTGPLYHAQMQCLFSSAVAGWVEEEGLYFSEKIDELNSDFTLGTLSQTGACDVSLSQIKSAQEDKGYKSLCAASGENAKKDYSLCRVAETAFNELCAYQEFSYFKTRPEILREECTTDSLLPGRDDCTEQVRLMESDLRLSREVLELSLEKYENFIESWTLHGWFSVLAESLENTYRRLSLARIAIAKWPLKFHDASSQRAGSLTAE